MRIGKIAAGLTAIALVACVVRNAKAQTPDAEQSAEDLREAEVVSKRHRAELMKIPHVRVVTGEVDGQNEAAILVEVDDQKNVDAVTRQLPSQIEGFPVEVDEGAPVDAQDEAAAAPTPFPTIDKNGYYHHTWIKRSEPAANPDAPQ
ncbi:MAG TPA: hypothetical protein VJX68_14890 [Candidatus Binatus sp.]|uniref:hypothetical protein n=1 Tax=Candidatus Binatus sp. TaxID=2811406 RepID=UPI002B47C37D|nr:hypothetical protein [Candidatus Binatus sp.]HKN14476.1 hypothetical protein [Candidatus Binatus sp.]